MIEMTDKLAQWLEMDDRTDPKLVYWIPKYILMRGDKPFAELGVMSPKMIALARSQDIIGWRHFTEGYISTHFYNIQNFHLAMNSSFLNGTDWTKQVIFRLLHILHLQWIFRNISLHDTTCGYLHNKRLEDVTLEIERLSSITPEEVPQESCFLLKINFAEGHMTLELKAYWILATKAVLAAQNKELSQDWPERIRNLVDTKIPSKKN